VINLKRLGAVIREYRVGLGLSQAELASRASIDRTYVSDVEAGTRNVSIGVLDRIATSLDADILGMIREAVDEDL
jgi:transcriptional regulator with XRE-family HTH domain